MKLTKAQLDQAGFAAFKASLAFQRAQFGRTGFMSDEAYWDGNNDVRLHWRGVAQAVLESEAGRAAISNSTEVA